MIPDVSQLQPAREEDEEEPSVKHLRDDLLGFEDLASLRPADPLVDGLLYKGTLAQISGPPGSFKSFLTVGMACSVASGESWCGHAVPAVGSVVYVAAEGASGLRARVHAWCDQSGVDRARLRGRLHVLPQPLQLGVKTHVQQTVEVVSELGAALIVFDTRARCTVGLEENSATQQGLAIEAAEQIARASGATVLTVHHSGRGGEHGRGSNEWDGALASDLRVTREQMRCHIRCAKHKDVPDGCRHDYRLVNDVVPEEEMPGCSKEQRSSLVAVRMGPADELAVTRQSSRTVLDIVRTNAGSVGLTRSEIAELAKERVGRSSVHTAVTSLVKQGAIRNIGSPQRTRYVDATNEGT